MRPAARLRPSDGLRFLAIALLLGEGIIHLQQYEGVLHAVPTINALFLINFVSAALIALAFAGSRDQGAIAWALIAIAITVVALGSLAVARASSLFSYSEPTLRAAVVVAMALELGAILAASGFIVARSFELALRPR
ncbi:MAG: hypothetical protein M3Y17_08255 [Actinomycetota bacterium]|nr:hypothetical protein [Actinomycetota bacterium]